MAKITTLCCALLLSASAWADKSDWPSPMMEMYTGQVLFDRAEFSRNDDEQNAFSWDTTGWYGGDYQRVVVRSEGEKQFTGDHPTELERLDVSYSYLLSTFWSVQAGLGLRGELSSDAVREHYGVLTLSGTAPYWFEVESNLLVNEQGDVQWLNEVEYDVLLTQTSYLQPRLSLTTNLTDSEKFEREAGVSSLRIGLRYRQEVVREFAPYIGVYWQKQWNQPIADGATSNSSNTEFGLVAGARFWF